MKIMDNHVLATTCGSYLSSVLMEQYFEDFLWFLIKSGVIVYFGKKAVAYVKWWMCGVTFRNLIR